jgi:hypothetical protein
MSTWIVVAVLIGVVLFLRWFAKQPFTHRRVPLSGLRRFVASLPAQMAPGGFFIADRESGPGFLQLALRDYGHMQCALEFGLPELDWSSDRFSVIEESLKQAHFDPAIEFAPGAVTRFMRVLVAGPEPHVIERADQLLNLVASGLGWSQTTTFRVRFGGSLAPGRTLERVRARGA